MPKEIKYFEVEFPKEWDNTLFNIEQSCRWFEKLYKEKGWEFVCFLPKEMGAIPGCIFKKYE